MIQSIEEKDYKNFRNELVNEHVTSYYNMFDVYSKLYPNRMAIIRGFHFASAYTFEFPLLFANKTDSMNLLSVLSAFNLQLDLCIAFLPTIKRYDLLQDIFNNTCNNSCEFMQYNENVCKYMNLLILDSYGIELHNSPLFYFDKNKKTCLGDFQKVSFIKRDIDDIIPDIMMHLMTLEQPDEDDEIPDWK